MPVIKLSNGLLHYKTVPLYEGVKIINKEIAFENLCLLKQVLDDYHVPFQLAYGTLLGAVREKDFITHDEDVDLFILGENRQKLFDTLPFLLDVGFNVARYDRRNLLSIIRKDEYIDFYIYDKFPRENDDLRICSGIVYPAYFFEHTTILDFRGVGFPVPENYMDFIRCAYGKDWKIPKQYFNYKKPFYKRLIYRTRETIKEWLPDPMYHWLASKAERKVTERTIQRMEKWREDMAAGRE